MGDSSGSMLMMGAIFLVLYFIGMGVYMAVRLIGKALRGRRDKDIYG